MDRTLVFAISAPIPRGNRVEVTERADAGGAASAVAVMDLESGIRYERAGASPEDTTSWVGRVLSCVVTAGPGGVRTTLVVDPIGSGASEADVALRGADAAAEAAKA